MNPRVKAWLEIIRLPNVLTSPGDPIAGLLIACVGLTIPVPWSALGWLCLASVLFYCAGMVLNDIMDLKEDLRDRPQRPIPSGRISLLWALNLFGLLSLGGLGLCAMVGRSSLIMGSVLLACILLYDLGLKKVIIFGPLSMGMCRGLNFLLGITALPSNQIDVVFKALPQVCFFTIVIYVAMVTMLARHETTGYNPGILRAFPVTVLVLGMIYLISIWPETQIWYNSLVFLAIVCVGVFLAYDAGRCIRIRKMVKPPMIGQFLAVLLLLQAAMISLSGYAWIGVIVLCAWPVNRSLRKWIAAS